MSQSQRRSLAPFRHSATTATPFAAAAAAAAADATITTTTTTTVSTTTTTKSAQLETPFWRNSRRRFRYLKFGEGFFPRHTHERTDERGTAGVRE